MKLCLPALPLALIALQSDRATVPDSAQQIVAEVGRVPMEGLRFQDAIQHIQTR
jgi:hypothetical protein